MSPSLRPAAELAPGPEARAGHVHAEPTPPVSNGGAQRWVWHGRFGAMLIEVISEQIYVNGQRVVRHAP